MRLLLSSRQKGGAGNNCISVTLSVTIFLISFTTKMTMKRVLDKKVAFFHLDVEISYFTGCFSCMQYSNSSKRWFTSSTKVNPQLDKLIVKKEVYNDSKKTINSLMKRYLTWSRESRLYKLKKFSSSLRW